ncbi:uncharacterized protein LOC131856953 [Cryptomeria japonica]|uniref:uncharacterized protein LOC131856953 n=1 Tax=Cryptomeria japonica TaxID=3369 RepID=UPI0027DAAF9B|nr:uncharacterized protein LOC131856953 [Cryptomeria japonica]
MEDFEGKDDAPPTKKTRSQFVVEPKKSVQNNSSQKKGGKKKEQKVEPSFNVDSLVNSMYENESVEYDIDVYNKAQPIDKELIENIVVRYLIICNQNLCDIQDFFPNILYEVLTKKRSKVVEKENDIQIVAIDKACSPLSKDARSKIQLSLNVRFCQKERVNLIMGQDPNKIKCVIRKIDDIAAEVSSEKLVIAKKVRKEVHVFAEQARFVREQIVVSRAKYESQQCETSFVPTGTPTDKTRVAKEAEKNKEEETKVKLVESQRGKPSKIQFRKKGKTIEPHVVPAQTRKRKKEKSHKLVTTIEETKLEEDKKVLRASAKKQKTTQKGLIPEEEEEKDKEDKDNTPDKLKGEDFLEGVKPTDLEPDNKYLYDDPVDTKPIDIPDDDDTSNAVNNDIDNVHNTGDNVANTADNVDFFEVDIQMDDPQEKQQDVNNEGEKEIDKSSSEQPVNAQSAGTQNPLVKWIRSLKEMKNQLILKVEILQRAYKESEEILATPEMRTVDAMEEFPAQILTHVEITETLLEAWDNDLKKLKFHFSDIFLRIAL